MSFTERHEIRSPFLSTPFWAVQEDMPSVDSSVPPGFEQNSNMGDRSRDGNPMAHEASFGGFDDYQRKTKSFPTTFVNSLSLPANDDEFPFGHEAKRPLHPTPLPRQVSSSGELPNWVAESVLITPQRELRKIVGGDDKSIRSDSAVHPSGIFRAVDEQRSPSTTWIRSTSSSGGIESRPNSFSFGAFDSLADSLGTALNLGSNPSAQGATAEHNVMSDSIFHRSLIDHPTSSEEQLPFAESDGSLSNPPIEQVARNPIGSFWPMTKGFGWRKKDGHQD